MISQVRHDQGCNRGRHGDPPAADRDWPAELTKTKDLAKAALEALESWRGRLTELQGQLAAAKTGQQAALEDHTSESEARVERIAKAQIREKVLTADLEHVRGPKNKLVSAVVEACQRCAPAAYAVYAARIEHLTQLLETCRDSSCAFGIVRGFASRAEPGHESASVVFFSGWVDSLLTLRTGRHRTCRLTRRCGSIAHLCGGFEKSQL